MGKHVHARTVRFEKLRPRATHPRSRRSAAINKAKGQPTTTTRYALAADGKTHTLTSTGKNVQGQIVNNVVVYEKQ
jgi:hypothetical protein